MPNPLCEKCKADKVEEHSYLVEKTGCREFYQKVEDCMKANHGNVASCRIEWKDFQTCIAKVGPRYLTHPYNNLAI